MRFCAGVVAIVVGLACVARAADGPAAAPASKGQAGFDQLKALVGEWRSTEEGNKSVVSYQLTAGDSVLVETLGLHGGMMSMYHLDNDALMMTHYCAAGNQPRMRAEPFKAGDKAVTFNFIDGTNMADANVAHMHKVVITFVDADHITHAWTMWEGGKAAMTVNLSFERVRK